MDEITVNSTFTFSKQEVLLHGLRKALEPSTHSLMNKIEEQFVALVAGQLQDDANSYQFTLSVKKIEADPDHE